VTKSLVIRDAAIIDVDRILAHLHDASPPSAAAFKATLAKVFRRMAVFPRAGLSRYGDLLDIQGLRHLATPRFPYLVFYVETSSAIAVVRVLHVHRDLLDALSEG
jgi:plasmid stabilization system protein ParE